MKRKIELSIFKLLFTMPTLLLFCTTSCSKKLDIDIPEPTPNFWDTTGNDINSNLDYDVVIYGGTPAGIMAAIEVSKSGKSVILLNSSEGALGGMITNGLGNTDVLRPQTIGGLSRQFFRRIKEYYLRPENWFAMNSSQYNFLEHSTDIMTRFEPRAAQFVVKNLIQENHIPVIHNDRLKWEQGVIKTGSNINYIIMESGKKIKGKMFIDASYEGDLMAKAGVSYTVGREGSAKYGERWNGIVRQSNVNKNQLPLGIKRFGNAIISPSLAANGTGDNKIQAYCYRMCLTDVRENKIDFPKPQGYDEEDYAILFEYLNNYKNIRFFDLSMMPNRKTDSNNSGPFSTDYIGANYNYPEASYGERAEIRAKHRRYQQGLMWTLANHPKIPERIRKDTQRWGLAKDEFIDNGHWPYQLYIREARRMIGPYVIIENNCLGKVTTEYSVGFGDYAMDSHIVQRFIDGGGNIQNEGHVMVNPPSPYKIDYRALVPNEKECSNLLVPVCLSASHIAYGSLRMEPVFMTLGQASACIAILALGQRKAVQGINYDDLKQVMIDRGMVF